MKTLLTLSHTHTKLATLIFRYSRRPECAYTCTHTSTRTQHAHIHIHKQIFSLSLALCSVSQYSQAHAHTNTNTNKSTHIGNACKVLANRWVSRILVFRFIVSTRCLRSGTGESVQYDVTWLTCMHTQIH